MTTRNREDVMGERVAVNDEELNEQRITTDDMAKTQPTEIRQEEIRQEQIKHNDQRQLNERNEQSSLLPENVGSEFRSEWDRIQVSFVDEPRKAVEQADSLVAQVMQHVARTFSDERKNLESQWSRGDNVSTEDLRIALQRYRTFFSRLLSV